MPKDFCFCPCFGNDSTDYAAAEPDCDPVLLISGIGGSILNSKTKDKGVETRVWVRILLADYTFQKKIWSLYNPNTGYTEVLDQSTELVVPDDDHGLFAIDILDPSLFVKLFHMKEVYHFHAMIDMLIKCGYKKGTTLFGYGYDFRQSNRIDKLMEGLKAKLETAYEASGNRKVNIISHSMGGLLVSCFMSLHADVFSKFVSKWICIACPFQGAPGCINDALLTGLQFVQGVESYFFVSRWTMHQLLVECPAIYEMLANPDFAWECAPQIQVWRKQSDGAKTGIELVSYCPLDNLTLFQEALKNNELTYNGNKVALPFNTCILKWAADTRQILNAAQLPKGVSFYNIFGTSNDTPFDIRYGTELSPIEDLSEICHTVPQYSYVDGDGTVPAESAKADGFEAVERVGIAASHRGLLHDQTVFSLIQNWLGIQHKQTKKHSRTTSKVVDASKILT
ncbi:phospholipase A(1) LCAT3 [Euphorbia lathyris]|uniref:phospholipase A(1) LCAT3 n=1 Tax=Euphorbia lathyris TaxID=212925 RepID=UPI003313713A